MYDIAATDANHVWLTGDEIMLFNGTQWQRQIAYPADASAVSAYDASNVWTAGRTIRYFNGSSWQIQQKPADFFSASGIYALDPSHVWAVGSGIIFYDGSTWEKQFETQSVASAIWAADANHAWAAELVQLGCHQGGCAYEEYIYYFDGSTWSEQYSFYSDEPGITAISGSSPSDVWAVGGSNLLRYNGTSWTRETSSYSFQDLEVLDANHIWAVTGSEVLFNDGANWFFEMSGLDQANKLSVSAVDCVWVKTVDKAWYYNGVGWTSFPFVSEFRTPWTDVTMSDAQHIWAIAGESVYFNDGSGWNPQSLPYTTKPRSPRSIYACDNTNAWILGGYGDFLYLINDTWGYRWMWGPQLYTAPGAPTAEGFEDITGLDYQHVWACGTGGIYFFDGTSWTLQLPGVANGQQYPWPVALYAGDALHVWALTAYGQILFFDGSTWSLQFDGSGKGYGGDIAGFGLNRVFAFFGGTDEETKRCFLFYDGSTWTYQYAPNYENIGGPLAVGPFDALALPYDGGLLENDGSGWREVDIGTGNRSYGIAMSDRGHAWMVGYGGTVLNRIMPPPDPPSGYSNLRWLAEGYTGSTFNEWLCLGNSSDSEAHAQLLYSFQDGGWETQSITVAPNSRATVGVNQSVGADRQVSVRIASDQPVVVERPMYFNYVGAWTGGHTVTAAEAPSTTWYFAEGNTLPGFDEYLCIFNPGDSPAELFLALQKDDGENLFEGGIVPPHSRYTYRPRDFYLAQKEISIKLVATQPVIAERAMYFDYGGWTGGSCVMGANGLSNEFYFAEGSTRTGFAEYLTLQNPSSSPIMVDATYQFGEGQGEPVIRSYVLSAEGRATVFVPSEVGPDKDVSVKLTSSSPFLAERPMYFDYTGYGANWTGGHCVIGAAAPASEWFFAEGCTLPGFHEYLCLQNPGDEDATVEITYLTQEAGALPVQTTVVPAHSRITSLVNVAAGEGYQLSCRIRVTSGPAIVAERPMYFDYGGWDGGHDALGVVP